MNVGLYMSPFDYNLAGHGFDEEHEITESVARILVCSLCRGAPLSLLIVFTVFCGQSGILMMRRNRLYE